MLERDEEQYEPPPAKQPDQTRTHRDQHRGKSKKHRGKSNLPVGGKFTPILNTVHDSAAYLDLSGNAAKLYHYLVRVARLVALTANASDEMRVDFDYTYSEAKRRGFSESTFKRAMRDLWDHGFINVRMIGGRTASSGRGRVSSRYQLAGHWQTYGKTGVGNWIDRRKFESDPWQLKSEPSSKEPGQW